MHSDPEPTDPSGTSSTSSPSAGGGASDITVEARVEERRGNEGRGGGTCDECSANCTRRLCCCFKGISEPVMILLTVILVGFEAYTMFVGFCIQTLKNALAAQIVVGIIVSYLTLITFFHYFSAVFVARIKRSRGNVTNVTALPPLATNYQAELEHPTADTSLLDKVGKNIETCRKCGRLRPLRTHHCSTCKVCSVRFDHHCPWVGCITMHNYYHFFAFIMFSTAGCILATVLDGLTLILSLGSNVSGYDSDNTFEAVNVGLSIFGCVIGIGMGLGTGNLLVFHIKISRSNETTVEYYDNRETEKKLRQRGIYKSANIYDLGSPGANMRETFGPLYGLYWCLPYVHHNKKSPFYYEERRKDINKNYDKKIIQTETTSSDNS